MADLLLCAATDFECSLLRERLAGNPSIGIVRTGVGAVNAAHAVTLFLAERGAREVIVCGVGGAYPSSGLEIGDVVSHSAFGIGIVTAERDYAKIDILFPDGLKVLLQGR